MRVACNCTHRLFGGPCTSLQHQTKQAHVCCLHMGVTVCMYASQTLKMDFPIALYLFFFIKHGLLLNVELADNWPGWPVSSGDQPRGPIPGNAGEHILFYFAVVVVWFGNLRWSLYVGLAVLELSM